MFVALGGHHKGHDIADGLGALNFRLFGILWGKICNAFNGGFDIVFDFFVVDIVLELDGYRANVFRR